MIFFLLLTIFSVSPTWAQLISERQVVMRETPDISSEQIKKRLVLEAGLQSLELLAPGLGVSSENFKESLNKKFTPYFEDYKDRQLQQAQLSNPEVEKEHFLTLIEQRRFPLLMKFLRMSDLIQSFTFKTFEKDPNDSQLVKSIISVSMNKEKVERLLKRLNSQETKKIANILIRSHLSLGQLNWQDLGLSSSQSFSSALNQSWEKWFNEAPMNNVEEALICDQDCLYFFDRWDKTPEEKIRADVPIDFQKSVLLTVDLNLQALNFVPVSYQGRFKWYGRVVFQDVMTKKVLASLLLPEEKMELSSMNAKELSSSLASAIYRSALSSFQNFLKVTTPKVSIGRVSRLVIRGQKSMSEVLAFVEILKKRSSLVGLSVKLDSFQQQEAQLLCFYQGEEKTFRDLLSGLKELKSKQSFVLLNQSSVGDFILGPALD